MAKKPGGFRPYQPTLFGKGRGPRIKPEENLQRTIVKWIHLVAPQVRAVHVPNEGKRPSVVNILLVEMGLFPGFPDLMLLWKPGRIAFAEVKVPGKYLQPHQREVMRFIESLNFPIVVLRSIEDARSYLRWLGIPTRESQSSVQLDLL